MTTQSTIDKLIEMRLTSMSEAILDRIKHDAYKSNIIPTAPTNYRSMHEVYGLDPVLSE